MNTKTYIFNLDYGNRQKEKDFIKQILINFDESIVSGCGICVNNNPYNFEFLLYVSLSKLDNEFEKFIEDNFKDKKRVYNYFLGDIFRFFFQKGYNIVSINNEMEVDAVITEEGNNIFLFDSKDIMNQKFNDNTKRQNKKKIFLSHTSEDKCEVDNIFNEFQKAEISVWYDKYEINLGDSISDKIDEGLKSSDIGIICISKKFLNSNWAKTELNYFLQKRLNTGEKTFIVLNFDVPHNELPALLQDYKYLNYFEEGIEPLIKLIKNS